MNTESKAIVAAVVIVVVFWLAVFVPVALDKRLVSRMDALEQRVKAIEELVAQPSPTAKAIASRLKQLEHLVLYPRFSRHAAGCRQCRGDDPSEEGGPSPLCERGFQLMQQDAEEAIENEGGR